MALPIIACGSANPQVFNAVQHLYQPEYEIVYHITSSSSGIADIPLILQGQTSSTKRLNQDHSPPVAIFIGAVYTDSEIDAMHQACQGVSSVPWLRMDQTVPRPPLGPGYAEHVVERIKNCMNRIKQEGKSGQDGMWYY